jgi:hypothetical protein
MPKTIRIAAFLVGSLIFFQGVCPAHPAADGVTLSFDHFYDHAELTKALLALERAYPQLAEVQSIGKSYAGRDIWAIILNNPKTGPAERKPGYYIDGNIHGNEIQGTEVALYAVYYLLKNYGKTELATRLLDERAFYVVPTMNPDSRDWFINKASDPNSPRSGLIPYDSDRDGVADEDGPDDLDGDGSFTQMRKKDPQGMYKPHPDDPRIMIRVKPGEKGEYILLGEEGIDNDGDGLINEDGPGGYDMNRNYGFNWQPDYVQRGSGDYPFFWPETKAVRDFILAHPNIAGAQNFHNSGGMILRGPGARNLGDFTPADRNVYDYIATRGEKILPGYRYITIYKDMYTVYGGSVDFLYSALGIFTFTNELDMDPQALPSERRRGEGEEPDEDLQTVMSQQRQLAEMFYHDFVLMGEQWSDWKPYKHPLYGDIEIGGVKKFGDRVPPLFRLAETCHRNAAFCLYHADQLARLEIEKAEVTKLNDNLFQVDVTIKNSRVTPSLAAVAFQNKLHRPDRLTIAGSGIELVAAGEVFDKFHNLTRKIKTQNNGIWLENGIPGFGRVELRLLVKGRDTLELAYDSLKGGTANRAVVLKSPAS